MQNNTNYVKVTFKQNNQSSHSTYQIKNDDIIFKDYETPYYAQQINDNQIKFTFFDCWLEEQTQKEIDAVPSIDINLIPRLYIITLSYQKNQTISSPNTTSILVNISLNSDKPAYIRSVFSKNTYIEIASPSSNNKYVISNHSTFTLNVFDVKKLYNKTVSVELDIYKDSLYTKKIGTILFPIEIIYSSNPAVD